MHVGDATKHVLNIDEDRLPELINLPAPLWITRVNSEQCRLLPHGCFSARDRRTWLLLACERGTLPLRLDGEVVYLEQGSCLLRQFPDNRLHLQDDEVMDWGILAFAYVGLNALSQDLQERLPVFGLPASGWALRQLGALAEGRGAGLGLAQAMRLVAGVLANVVEHNLQTDAAVEEGSDLLRRAVDALNEAAEGDRSLSEVLSALGVSRAHLGKLFRDRLQTSPGRYLQERRIRCAAGLLRHAQLDVSSIAARLGYSSGAAFGAAFRAATGMTPTDYRNSRSVPLGEE